MKTAVVTNFTFVAQAIVYMHPKMIKLDNLYLFYLFILDYIGNSFLCYVDIELLCCCVDACDCKNRDLS